MFLTLEKTIGFFNVFDYDVEKKLIYKKLLILNQKKKIQKN